jgi:hypothetical protein
MKTYRTKSGRELTGSDLDALADEAEAGYDVDHLIARRGKRGRPTLGTAPATVESVRLDPEMKDRIAERARNDGVSTSEVIRAALQKYLQAS